MKRGSNSSYTCKIRISNSLLPVEVKVEVTLEICYWPLKRKFHMLPYAFTTTSDNSATLYTQFSITLMTWWRLLMTHSLVDQPSLAVIKIILTHKSLLYLCLKVMSSFPKSTTSSFVKDYPFSMVLVTAKIISRFFDLMQFFSLRCLFTKFFCFHGHNSHQHSATFFA